MAIRDLGVGVIWWPSLDPLCSPDEGLVDVIEVEPETFWVPAGDQLGFHSFVREAIAHLSQPKLLHCVGAAVGGTCVAPDGYAETLARDVTAVRPDYLSVHLSVAHFRPEPYVPPRFAGFLLPPAESAAGVALAAANIRRLRAAVGGGPLAVETAVSYLPPAPGEWPDGAYTAAVAEAADCGILLDLHNVLCNARNGRQSMESFCHDLPLERVWELHLAGGEDENGFRLDAHSGPADPELMEFAASLVPRLPNLRAVVFEIMPERALGLGLPAVARQLGQMRELWDRRDDRVPLPAPPKGRPSLPASPLDPSAWERLLGGALAGDPAPEMDAPTASWWHSAAPALQMYRLLVGEGRASAVASAAPMTTRALLRACGGAATRDLLAAFWQQSPPGFTAIDEARAFLRFLSADHPPISGLDGAIATDAASLAGF